MSSSCSADYTIALGYGASSSASYATALGINSSCGSTYGVCLGCGASDYGDTSNYSMHWNISTPSVSGSIYYLGFNYTTGKAGPIVSRARYKKDIITFDGDSIDMINKLRPVYYKDKYIAKVDKEKVNIGFIAEEVVDIVPEVVPINKDGQPETVLYDRLIPVLVDALQKQNKIINEQQNKIDTLEERI